jgi:PAS domain S-box-containing protein
MTPTPLTPDPTPSDHEARRVLRLWRLQLLDTPPEPAFDALVELAAQLTGLPTALLTFVDDRRVWFKAKVGANGLSEQPRNDAFCPLVVDRGEFLEVEDATRDPRTATLSQVRDGYRARHYAGVPIRLSDGTVPGTLCVISPTPGRLTAEQRAGLARLAVVAAQAVEWRVHDLQGQALRESLSTDHERLAQIVAGLHAGTWEWNIRNGEAHVNRRWAETLGYTLEELGEVSVDRWLEFVHPDDLLAAGEALQRHGANPRVPYELEYRMRHRDGRWLWVHSRGSIATWTPDGRPEWMCGVYMDVTARKDAEVALRRATSALELTNRVARIGTWSLDAGAHVVQWSELTRELHDVPPDYEPRLDEAIGFYREGEDRDRIAAAVQRAFTTGEPFDLELRLVTARGREHWVRTVGLAETVEGRVVRVYGSFHDIDERVRAEEVRRARLQAEQSNAAKSQFVARMSHELRTPLNAILGFTDVLLAQDDQLGSEARRHHLLHARLAGQHLLALVNDLLDLSRVESGTLDVQRVPLDVVALVKQTVAELEVTARRRAVELTVEGDASATAWGDPTRLRQVLHNLVGNAVHYNRPNGRAIVRLLHRSGRVGDSSPHVEVQVRDTGVGMTPEQLRGLFEPFNRLGRERTTVTGTGIGLVITRHLLQLMGSPLEVESQAGAGSVFRFMLPSSTGEPVRSVPGVLGAPGGPAGEPDEDGRPTLPAELREELRGTVVYVDDDEVNRLLMEAMLRLRPGVRLLMAETGRTGIALALQARPQLLLLDMMLPDLPGAEVLAAVRTRMSRSELPCVGVSANAQPQDIQAALDAGLDGYLTKPVRIGELLEVVDRWLARPISN